jgi:hypothetical protein
LERISDYLLPGPGVWWKETLLGIEFFDGCKEENSKSSGPAMQHFRSSDLSVIDQHLCQCWEECLQSNITLPLKEVRRYQPSSDENSQISTEEEAGEEISDETPIFGLKWANNANVTDTCTPSTSTTVHNADSSALTVLDSTDHIDMVTQDPLTDNSNNNVHTQQTTCDNAQSDTHEDVKCKTKLGDTLMKIIQNRSLVRKFDELRAEAKHQKKRRTKPKHKQQYLYYEKKVKLEVQTCLTRSKAQIDKFRTEFIARTGCPPSTRDYPANISGLLSLCKTCKTVLTTEWNASA